MGEEGGMESVGGGKEWREEGGMESVGGGGEGRSGIERAADNTSCLSLSFGHNASRNKTTPPHGRISPSHGRQ